MLNEVNAHNPIPVPPFFVEPGTRFQSILSAELLPNGDPIREFLVPQPDGTTASVFTTDPGLALQTGDFRGFPFGHLAQFKIPTLWGVKATAPYFHNSGAKTLEAVLDHYELFFIIATPAAIPGAPPIVITPQDKADVIAFLKLL
jgi:cytochrome c peroxidase